MQSIPDSKGIILAPLQYSVLHDSSDIIVICWFAAKETFLIINVEKNKQKEILHTKNTCKRYQKMTFNSCLIFLWKLWHKLF